MKPVVDGVYSRHDIASWPLSRPRTWVRLFPQLLDGFPLRRPVSPRKEIRRAVEELDRDGVSILRRTAPSELLNEAIGDMNRFVEQIPQLQGTVRTKPRSTGGTRQYPVHEYQQELKIYRSHDPLAFSPTYAKFLLLPELAEVATCYLGTPWFYQAMIATRTEAVQPTRAGFAEWHHDARGRKLNAILLLTDVPEDGPATVVLKGSHRLLYSRERLEHNFFTESEVAALQGRYRWRECICHAPAGSLVLFDSNALHRGRRSRHPRDAFQVNCMTKRNHLWSHEIPKSVLAALASSDQRALLQRADLSVTP